MLLAGSGGLRANPSGEQVVGGAANFARPDASTLLVHQQTDRAVINWNNFSIANGELTRFVQPSSSSAVLNRVVTANPSQIYGTLQANGQVFLINPGGVMVGPGGVVDVAGFVASTHDIGTEEFMKAGSLNFHGNSEAAIVNQGNVTAREGDVFLVAREVKNEGQLMAKDGTVGMVSGTEVSLQAVGQGNFKIRLLAAENESTAAGGARREAGGDAEIVNEGVIAAANAVLEAKGSYLPMAIKNTGVIQATGVIHNPDGTVTLTGGEGDVLNTGVVAALQRSLDGQKETGGSILLAGKNVTSDPGSIITAAGRDGGGTVTLRAAETTLLRGSIEVVGSSESAKGGKVQLLGEKVGMLDGAKVNASGGSGGGEVLVGGDYLGKNPAVPNAKAVVMAPTAEIRADATVQGDGGKVILWSDNYTAFFGEITAFGGPGGGDGGFVETSSAGNLQAGGWVSAAAPRGAAGQWLLDPGNITISSAGPTTSGGFSGGNPDVFTAPQDPSVVKTSDINRALNNGTSVTIQTGTGGTYDITYDLSAEPPGDQVPISKTLDNDTTLTLSATGDITINSDITSTSNRLFMKFFADADGDGSGVFSLGVNADLLTNGGDVTITSSPGSPIVLNGTINTLQTVQFPMTVTAPGIYGYDAITGLVNVPGITISAPTATGGTTATATAVMGLQTNFNPLDSIDVTFGGTGYTSAPKVTIVADPLDPLAGGAQATAVLTGDTVTAVLVTNPGAGYTRAPTIRFSGGGGTGATAEVDVANGFEVVNLRFAGADPFLNPPSAPTYGVGYLSTEFPTATDGFGNVIASGTIQNLAGNVSLLPSQTEQSFTLGAGGFVDSTAINRIAGVGSISVGTITVGDRLTGNVTVDNLALNAGNNINLALVSGGTLTDVGGAGATIRGGLLTLSASGSIGGVGAGNTFNIAGGSVLNQARVSLITEGDVLNVTSANDLIQLHVQTDGTVATQSIADGGNLNYSVAEIGGLTSFLAGGVSVSAESIDLKYTNTAGDILILGDILNTQAALDGRPNVFRDLEIAALNGTIFIDSGVSLFSGGGNMTLSSLDLFLLGAEDLRRTSDYPVGGYEFFGVLNTFQSSSLLPNPTATFGTRAPAPPASSTALLGTTGIISGTGGVLTLNALSTSGEGRKVFISDSGAANSYNLDRYETMLLEAPAIRIGGDQAADILIEPISNQNIARRQLTYYRGNNPGTNSATVFYRPRFFENPFFNAGTPNPPGLQVDPNAGPDLDSPAFPHVEGGTVSLVSARGSVKNLPDGDLNVFGFSMTGVDGVEFDGRGSQNSDYAGQGLGADIDRGSLFDQLSGRVGRTILDQTVGSGGDFQIIARGGVNQVLQIVDGRELTSGTSFLTSNSAATAAATVSGGQVTRILPSDGGYQYSSSPVVTITGGGIQEASARALVGNSGTVERVVPQIAGLGYTSAPDVIITGGGGSGATARAFVNSAGVLSPFEVTGGGSIFYESAPTVQIFGNGTGAVARPILSNGTSGTLVGLQIVDPGSGYTSVRTVVLSGGGQPSQNQASVALAAGYDPSAFGGQITPIYLSSNGRGYTSEPTVTLSGGGIRPAQAVALVDTAAGSATRGQVTGYRITDPGQGYRSAPTVTVGQGQAFGNFGEYGISTEQVDRNRPSGDIVLDTLTPGRANSVYLNAPVRTGNAFGVGGAGAISGSILIDTRYVLLGNTDLEGDGALITGDAQVFGTAGTSENAFSGSITLQAYSIGNTEGSALVNLTGSLGLPVQIGTAKGAGGNNITGALNAAVTDRVTEEIGAGDLQIYAPAPGELETAAGGPIDPNHQAQPPRASNDLFLTGLRSDSVVLDSQGNPLLDLNGVPLEDESLISVEVGGYEGKLTLLQFIPAYAVATIGTGLNGRPNGQVTLITSLDAGPLFTDAPAVIITGGGIVQAQAQATVSGGQVVAVNITNPGEGYGDAPTISITLEADGNTSATAVAQVVNGRIVAINITDPGFGYDQSPTVTIGPPAGTAATATATSGRVEVGDTGEFRRLAITSVTLTGGGTGYRVAPEVTFGDTAGLGFGAIGIATINDQGQVTGITIEDPGFLYANPTVTFSAPAGIAIAEAQLVDRRVGRYVILDPGAGYVSAPTVLLASRTTDPTTGEIRINDPYNLDIDKVALFADRQSLFPDAQGNPQITASAVAVAPYTNQHPLDLVASTSQAVTGSLSLTPSDLLRFLVDDLILGRRQPTAPAVGTGVITVSQAVTSGNLGVKNGIVLAGTREIRDAGGSTGISIDSLVLDAGGQIRMTGSGNQYHYFSAVIRDSGLAPGAEFLVNAGLRPQVLTGRTTGSSVLLPMTVGSVFVNAAYATGQRFYDGITTQGGDISIFADQIQQTPLVGFLDTTGGNPFPPPNTSQVTLAPNSAGTPINLYATTPASGSLALRVGNSEAPGLELVSAKELVIGSGSVRDVQLTEGGFGYTAPPQVTLTGGGGTGAEAVAILRPTGSVVDGVTYYSVAGIRITNPGTGYTSAPTITVAAPELSGVATARGTAALGAAGAISLNSNLEFNYGDYQQAPYQVSLVSGSTGSITAGANQLNPSLTSRVRVGSLTLIDAGAVSLGGANDVDKLAAILTGSGSSGNLSFADIDGIELGRINITGNLTIVAGTVVAGEITQTGDGITVAGTSSFATSLNTGGQAITLTSSANDFGGAVSLVNTGAFNVAITDKNALSLGTLSIGQNLTALSNGALNLGQGTIGGTLTANSFNGGAGNAGPITQTGALVVSGVSSFTAGAAAITLANANNSFGGAVTLSNTGDGNAITLVSGLGDLTLGNITSAGAVNITATAVGQTLLFNGNYGSLTGSLTATAESSTGSVNLTINSAMTSLQSATLTTDGVFTLAALANLGNNPGNPAATTTASIFLTTNSDLATALGASLTAESITLQPYTPSLSLGLNSSAAGFNVPASILEAGAGQRIFAKNSLILGSTAGTGGILIGGDGPIDLSFPQTYSLTLRGSSGGVTFLNSLTLADDSVFDLSVGTSNVTGQGGGSPDVIIGGNGTISFGSVGNVDNFTGNVENLGTSNVSGFLEYTSLFPGSLTVGQMTVAENSTFTLPAGATFSATNPSNSFAGTVSLLADGGPSLGDIALINSRALLLGVVDPIGGNLSLQAPGISGGALEVTGTTTLNGRGGNISLINPGNIFGGGITVLSSANTALFVDANGLQHLGSIQASQNFSLITDASTLSLPTAGEAPDQLSSSQISNFSVGSLSLTAGQILINDAFRFSNIQTLALASTTGSIRATAPVTVRSLSLDAGTFADFSVGNRVQNLGPVRTRGGNMTFVNVQGMNLAGTVSVAGNATLTVAGQFYDFSGSRDPFAGTTGTAVITSLSMFGGLPNLVSAVPGFKPGYFFQSPGGNRQMIYAVGPLTMFAPGGTVIAGVDLSGTQTGGGQFNTFLTGSDNLNWIVSDFGKFNLPKVEPARLEYMLYPQRVEPETRSLPQPMMRELTQELGRPPTIEEIQQREIAKREAVRLRTGVVLERSSFDEDVEEEPMQEATGPTPVLDGGKPQAEASREETDQEGQLSEAGKQASGNLQPQAKKQTDTKRDPNGPVLRSGPRRAVALRDEPLDPARLIQEEREKAAVGVAQPIAGMR